MTVPTPEIRKRILRNGDLTDPSTPSPMLTLEEFFTGNDDPGSICCNISDAPSPVDIHRILNTIRDRSDVAGVYVEVKEIEDDQYDMWPFSDTVWVVTSASIEEIKKSLGDVICADDILTSWDDHQLEEVPVPEGMRPLGLWWD
ncbi:MAG: hypothetical protein AAGH99_16120 [Planctomycetota bacterium]